MHRRCGPMRSQIFSTPTSPMRRRRRRCIADAARSSDPIYSDPIWEASAMGLRRLGVRVLLYLQSRR
eukprot:4640153-Pyramimonas_sp.AAC.1